MNRSQRFSAVLMFCLLVVLVITGSSIWVSAADSLSPLLLAVNDTPVPFMGSDGRVHLVYELAMTNFSSADIGVEKVEVLAGGAVLQTLDSAAVAGRLQPAGQRDSTGTLTKGSHALLFLNVSLPDGGVIPHELSHRVSVRVEAAPPGHQEFAESGGSTAVDRRSVAVIGPPLQGERYISADSCCDATRHTRAALPVNGRVWVAQRYAVDWEQTDAEGRIYVGPRESLQSYAIFGKQALAVADGRVASIIDGLPEQVPGKFPANLPLEQADGNSVILDLGDHRFALYAHLQPGSIKVRAGDHVKTGQVLGLVGDTGNSIVPHLHFHVMDGPSPLASNGLPYEISSFEIAGKTPGTVAFDEAESNGTPLPIVPITPPQAVKHALPLDQLIISFAGH